MDDNVNDLILSLLENLEKYGAKDVEYKFKFENSGKKYQLDIKLEELAKEKS